MERASPGSSQSYLRATVTLDMPFEPCPRRGCRAEQGRCGHCYPEGCAATSFVPCQRNTRRPLSKLEGNLLPRKITVTSKSPVGDISVVTLIRTDTTLDHSQKAEKVCTQQAIVSNHARRAVARCCSRPLHGCAKMWAHNSPEWARMSRHSARPALQIGFWIGEGRAQIHGPSRGRPRIAGTHA